MLPKGMRFKHGSFYYVDRHNKWHNLGKDSSAALEKYQQLLAEKFPAGTVGYMLDRYMREVAIKKAPRTYADNMLEVKSLYATFGQMRTVDVRPMHIARFLDERGKDAPVRANREKALLSHAFTMGMRWGIVDINPCRGVARNPERGRSRYVTDAEFDAVLGLANQTVADGMGIALATAQRIGDILTIRLEDIFDDGILFEPSKIKGRTGKKILVGMSDAMRMIVDRRRKTAVEYLFEHDGEPYTYDGFSAMFKRTVKKAIDAGLLRDSFTFHDIRAKALTDAARAGMNAQVIAGHADPRMTAHYVKRREVEIVKPIR